MKTTVIILLMILSGGLCKAQIYWEATGNVTGTVFSFSPDSAGGFLCGTSTSVLRTTDGGDTWVQKIKGGTYSNYIAFCINKNGHIFVGTHSSNMPNSTDNGETWTNITTLGHPDPRPIIFLDNGDMLAVPYSSGMHKSVDTAKTWTSNFPGLDSGIRILSLAVDRNKVVWAGSDRYIFKSSDNGSSWEKVPFDTLCPEITSLLILRDGTMIAGSKTYKCGIFRSTDDGVTWERAFSGLNLENYDYVFSMLESPNGNIFVSTSADGVYMSRDKGLTAMRVNTGIADNVVFWWALGIDPTGRLFVGTNKGMYRSTVIVTDVEESTMTLDKKSDIVFKGSTLNFIPDKDISGKCRIEIYSMNGERLISLENEKTGTQSSGFSIDCSSLNSGLYFYRIIFGTKLKTGKILKTE